MLISIVLGTRPEIIKMSPVIRECERRGLDYFVLHSGQHYSYEMDGVFFEDLELPQPDYNLDVGSGTHSEQTSRIMVGAEKTLMDEKPEVALVQGDTNTVLGGALAASKLHVKVGHVEAGLRSFDRRMPEEINRIVADHLSDYLFAPTENSRANLLREGIGEGKIFITGNTIVDAVFQKLEISKRRFDVLRRAIRRLNQDKLAGKYLVILMFCTSLVFLIGDDTIKSRLIYNVPIGVFAALGFLKIRLHDSINRMTFYTFISLSLMVYLFRSLATIV